MRVSQCPLVKGRGGFWASRSRSHWQSQWREDTSPSSLLVFWSCSSDEIQALFLDCCVCWGSGSCWSGFFLAGQWQTDLDCWVEKLSHRIFINVIITWFSSQQKKYKRGSWVAPISTSLFYQVDPLMERVKLEFWCYNPQLLLALFQNSINELYWSHIEKRHCCSTKNNTKLTYPVTTSVTRNSVYR